MSKADDVCEYTYGKIKYLEGIARSGEGKKFLAELRRGIGKKPGEMPTLWGMIFEGMDEELMGRDTPSYEEWAVYTALTLYALHSQGFDGSANVTHISIGKATAELIENDDDVERVIKHLNLVVTANSPEEIAYRLRTIITLLRNHAIPLDYAKLAKELYYLQCHDVAEKIKLQWGRDFYKKINCGKKGEKENE